jgi:hypothetical protein
MRTSAGSLIAGRSEREMLQQQEQKQVPVSTSICAEQYVVLRSVVMKKA